MHISESTVTSLNSLFLLHVQVEVQICFYLNIKLFLKTKIGFELVSLPHFLHEFWRKIFLTLYFINWPNFIVWLSLLLEMLGNMSNKIVCFPGFDLNILKINLNFFLKLFFDMTKGGQKLNHLKNDKNF